MTMPKRAFIIHGWGGYPDKNWFPWLKDQLIKKGFVVSVPQMPESDHPKMDSWLSKLSDEVGKPDKECYFIGHSLGCITILRYLERLEATEKIGGAVFVAAFDDDLGIKELAASNFFLKPVDWVKVNEHCNNFVAIFSDNDYYVSLDHSDVFKKKLEAKVIVKHAMGHLNEKSGVRELPDVLEAVLKMSS